MKTTVMLLSFLIFISLWSNYRNFGEINNLKNIKPVTRVISDSPLKVQKEIDLIKVQIKQLSKELNKKSLNVDNGVTKANSAIVNDKNNLKEEIELNEDKYERKFNLINERILKLELNRNIIVKPYKEKGNN